MKRFCLVIFPIICLVLSLCLASGKLSEILKSEITGEIQCFETKEITYAESNLGFVVEQRQNIKNALCYISGGEVVGECVFVNGGKQKLNLLMERLGIVITNKYMVDNKHVVEGVSSLLGYKIDGRRANVQMVADGQKIIVGSPIIYGSY